MKDFARKRVFSGVYFLLLNDEIVYIGTSRNVHGRVAEHRANGRPFDKAFFVEASGDDREMLERALIKAITPSQNRMHNPVAGISRERHAIGVDVEPRQPEPSIPPAAAPVMSAEALSFQEARRRVGVLAGSFSAAVSAGAVPFAWLGRKRVFAASAVDAWQRAAMQRMGLGDA